MTEEQKQVEDMEMMQLQTKFNMLLQSLDNQQRSSIIANLQGLLPSGQM
jgi:hypothetical protein